MASKRARSALGDLTNVPENLPAEKTTQKSAKSSKVQTISKKLLRSHQAEKENESEICEVPDTKEEKREEKEENAGPSTSLENGSSFSNISFRRGVFRKKSVRVCESDEQVDKKPKRTKSITPIKSKDFYPPEYVVNNLITTRSKISLSKKFNEQQQDNLSISKLILTHINDGDKEAIYKYLLSYDSFLLIDKSKSFTLIQSSNRALFMEWILRVHDNLRIDHPTFFATVRIFDLIMLETYIPQNMIQMIGLVTYLLFAKYYYGEITYEYLISQCQLKKAKSKEYKKHFMLMEKKVYKFLNFDLNVQEPTWFVYYYFSRLKDYQTYNESIIYCAFYILESFALNTEFSKIPAWHQAVITLSLAIEIILEQPLVWKKMNKIINLDNPHIQESKSIIIKHVGQLQKDHSKYLYVNLKYQNKKYAEVSIKVQKYCIYKNKVGH